MRVFKWLLILGVIVFGFSFFVTSENKCAKIFSAMFDSIKNVKGLHYQISAVERLEHEIVTIGSDVKLQVNPRKIYFTNPARKLQILYNSSESTKKILLKIPILSHLSVHLDLDGNLVRKNQHYTMNELGFEFIGQAMKNVIVKDNSGFTNFIYHGKCIKNNNSCYLIEYHNSNFNYVEYHTSSGETITNIARKLLVNEHIIRYKNGMMNDFGTLKRESIILVPNLFCKRAMVFIDEKTMLPASLSVFDDKGLCESYDFKVLELNPRFSDSDFDKNNKAYKF
jgi:outer membrane lipoprotein-sorting protein